MESRHHLLSVCAQIWASHQRECSHLGTTPPSIPLLIPRTKYWSVPNTYLADRNWVCRGDFKDLVTWSEFNSKDFSKQGIHSSIWNKQQESFIYKILNLCMLSYPWQYGNMFLLCYIIWQYYKDCNLFVSLVNFTSAIEIATRKKYRHFINVQTVPHRY